MLTKIKRRYSKDAANFLFGQLLIQGNDAGIEKFFQYVEKHSISEMSDVSDFMKSYLMRVAPRVCLRYIKTLPNIATTIVNVDDDYLIKYIEYLNACSMIEGNLD